LPACFIAQNASSDSTWGKTAKLYIGGGEAVDHSSVRPFQGSPVRSMRLCRVRMLTTSCAMVAAMPQRMIRAPIPATIR
jgi:hypothetical protein